MFGGSPSRREVPLALLVSVGLLLGALGGAWWSLEQRPPSAVGTVAGAAPDDSVWTRRGWDVDPAHPEERFVVRITTERCGGLIRGTGVIVNGAVLTNRHVVDGATSVTLTGSDGSVRRVRAVGISADVDLARLEAPGLAAGLSLASPSDEPVGSTLSLLGFPGGHQLRRRAVTVDASRRGWGFPDPDRPLHVAAPVVPGESGSPLVDGRGEVAALVYARANDDGAGLAISATELYRETGRLVAVPFARC